MLFGNMGKDQVTLDLFVGAAIAPDVSISTNLGQFNVFLSRLTYEDR